MPRKRLPWIKLWFEMLGDPKMTRLTLAERGCWHEILLLAGQSPVRGKLMLTESEPMTMDDIARALSLTPDEYPVLESCVGKLVKLNSLSWNEHNCLEVVHFIERQDKYPSDLKDYHKKSPDKLLNNSDNTPETLRKEEEGRGEGQKKKMSSPNGEDIPAQKTLQEEKMERFNRFWKQYPKKRNKGHAEKAFKKVAPDEQLMAAILTAIERAKKSAQWLKDDGQYIPYPATWLDAKGWEDEYPSTKKTNRSPPRKAGRVPDGTDLDEQERRLNYGH